MEPHAATQAPGARERRADRRVSVDLPALVSRRGVALLQGRIRNLSRSGLYLACEGPGLPFHDCIEIGVAVSGGTFVRLPLRMVRCDRGGLGLAFAPGPDLTRSPLQRSIRRAACASEVRRAGSRA